jgi:hypothetical protein
MDVCVLNWAYPAQRTAEIVEHFGTLDTMLKL